MKAVERHVAPSSEYFSYSAGPIAHKYLLYPLLTGHFLFESGYEINRASFDSFLIELILGGTLNVETEDGKFTAGKNDVVLIDCYKWHRYYSRTGGEMLWIHFDGAPARGYYEMITHMNGNVFSTRNAYGIERNISELFETFKRGQILGEAQAALLLTRVLTAMTLNAKPTSSMRCNDFAMSEIIYRINENLDKPLHVGELAKMSSSSKYHFIRTFNRAVGMTPRQYIITARMDQAKYLLKSTPLTVQEIGVKCGYSSASMFCASFKRVVGLTPSQYRNDASALARETRAYTGAFPDSPHER
ncbi:MAG: helix-turn-helix domain-containing protein [Christensenellales bacterium]|jgi:AraC family transcriptional regulator